MSVEGSRLKRCCDEHESVGRCLVVAASLQRSPARAQGKLNVITTTEDLASIAREVGGDRITVEAIARGYQDPHFVEAKPSFILKLQKADVLIVVGRELEIGWLPPLIQQSRNAKIQPGARRVPRRVAAGARSSRSRPAQVTRAMGDVHPLGNPHYWLDPENGKRDRQGHRRQVLAAPAERSRRRSQQRLADFTDAARRRREAVAGADGAVQGHEGGDLPPLVPELRRRASASTSSATSSRSRASRRRRSTRSI